MGLALVVAVVFSAVVMLTGKGDAMGGSSSVRTSFKGKAGFDDFVSRLTLGLGAGFLALIIILDALAQRKP
jgi:preprotein translocase subunit SecG